MNLDKLFHLKERNTDVKTEVIAGITTFMTMAYILAVNPSILSASGMDSGAVFTATALASMIATLLMAAFANYPFVLAPGMGLNAYFAYTVVLQMGYTWQMALAAVFLEGIVFIVALDITYRTYVGTDAALHATVFLYVETLVGDEHILEETTHHLGEEPWDRTFDQSADAFLAVEDLLADNGKFLCRILLLPDFTLLRIHIHERQTDVRFRHDERVGG